MQAITISSLCAIISLAVPALGQLSQSNVEPDLREANKTSTVERAKDQVTSSTEVLIPALKGLAIANTPDAALALQALQKSGIQAKEFTPTQQQDLQKQLQPFIRQPVTLATLGTIARITEKTIAATPDSLLIAKFPPQEITSGHIALHIGVPNLQNISFAGQPRFGKNFLSSAVLTRPGSSASSEAIRKDLEFLNRNPFRKASALWQPTSTDALAAKLIFHVKEKTPWSIFAGFDNQASDALGDDRAYIGGKFGNVFQLDHRLSWMLLTSADADSLHAAHLSYEIPLPQHHLLHLSAGISESATQHPSTLIENNGQFFHLRAHLEKPLPDWKNIRHKWKTGFSLRDNHYQQGANETDVTLFMLENLWEAEVYDRHGHTDITAGLLWNPGDSFLSSSDATYASLGADDSYYAIATFKAERRIPLRMPLLKNHALKVRAEAQCSNQSLLASDQYAAAGANRLRGYDESSAFFDSAMFLSAEWHFPRVRLPHSFAIQPHAFIDSAWLADENADSEHLTSLGIGCQMSLSTHYAAKLDLAIPLDQRKNQHRDPELHFSLQTFW